MVGDFSDQGRKGEGKGDHAEYVPGLIKCVDLEGFIACRLLVLQRLDQLEYRHALRMIIIT